MFYGLDWIATVPPTVRLTSEFGRENTGVVYGWIGASHQLGASLAAFGAGAIRTVARRLPSGVLDCRHALCARRTFVSHDWTRCARKAHTGSRRSLTRITIEETIDDSLSSPSSRPPSTPWKQNVERADRFFSGLERSSAANRSCTRKTG